MILVEPGGLTLNLLYALLILLVPSHCFERMTHPGAWFYVWTVSNRLRFNQHLPRWEDLCPREFCPMPWKARMADDTPLQRGDGEAGECRGDQQRQGLTVCRRSASTCISFSLSARHSVILSKGQNDCKPKSLTEESSTFSVAFGKVNDRVNVWRDSGDGRYTTPCRDMTGEWYSTLNSRSKVSAPNSPFSEAQEIHHPCYGISLGNICWPKVIFLS